MTKLTRTKANPWKLKTKKRRPGSDGAFFMRASQNYLAFLSTT